MADATTAAATTTTAAATTAAATTTTAAAATTVAAPTAFDWNTSGLDPVALKLVGERGWKAPSDLVMSYTNLEKLTGVPPEQIIKLPKEMTDVAMGEVWDRLGRPKAAADYKLEAIKGSDPELSKTAATWFHEAGAPASMATKIVEKWNAHAADVIAKNDAAYKAKVEGETVALKSGWGEKYDANLEIARNAAKSFGMSAEHISALEGAMGFAGVHKLLFTIGSKIGEAEFVQGGGRRSDFGGTTPESARQQIDEMKNDRAFIARFNSADPVVRGEAQAEMNRLMKVAYPGEVATG